MRDKLRSWIPTRRDIVANTVGNVLVTVPGVIITILSGLTAWIAVPQSDAGWVRWFLTAMLAISATWALIAWGAFGWRRFRSLPQRVITSDPPTTLSTKEPVAPASRKGAQPPIVFAIEGDWLNTPFKRGDAGTGVFSEDAYLTLTANDFLEFVRVEILATEQGGLRRQHAHWHKGKFQGTLTPGMIDTIRIFRRTFDFEKVSVKNDKGGHTHTQRRRMLDVILFDGTEDEVKVSAPLISVEVKVHRKRLADEAVESVSFVLDVDRVLSPQSRLIVSGGPLQVNIPNHYARQFGAAMIYEDIAQEPQASKSDVVAAKLVEFVERGLEIRDTFMKGNDALQITVDRQTWVKAIEEYLSENLERVHIIQFKAARGDGMYPANRSAEGGGLWADIGGKIKALNKIIDEIRNANK
jgi:hypothetical protein